MTTNKTKECFCIRKDMDCSKCQKELFDELNDSLKKYKEEKENKNED